MKTVDENFLRSYVDGELSREQSDELEQALVDDLELQAQLQAMRASCLPYAAAFEAQRLPPMPESLRRYIDAMASEPRAKVSDRGGYSRRRWLGAGAALAASFGAGFITNRIRREYDTYFKDPTPWVDAIATYQSLYVRATVDKTHEDVSMTRTALAEFAHRTTYSVTVPDLGTAGLFFVRMQRLVFGDHPMLQMVYLPKRGDPAAFCVLPTTLGDSALEIQQRGALSVAAWQSKGLAYVFVANMPLQQNKIVAKLLAANRFGPLISMV